MKQKIDFKNLMLIHSKEYENINFLNSITRILSFLYKINPQLIINETLKSVFEIDDILDNKK